MKALIFAAGLGTRLGDLTKTCPKALVEVGGVPMLERVILKLKQTGISEMVINVHHHADMIVSFLRKNSDFGVKISISDERDRLLDTGGGLLKARSLLDGNEPIMLHNADILTDFDIAEMAFAHQSSRSDVTLLVDDRRTSRYLLFDCDRRMMGWTDRRTGEVRSPWERTNRDHWSELAFGGVHIVSPTIFPRLQSFSDGPEFSITPFYISACKDLHISGFTPSETYHWIDIGKPESLMAAENIVSELRQIQPEV